jgi:hypothetical protein
MGTLTARVLAGILLALSAPGAALGASAVPARPEAVCATAKLVNLYTLHIEAKPSKKVYRRGETIVIDVAVTRPAEEDPGGNQQPMPRPTTEPAADVEVGGAIWVGNTYRWDFATTDEDGHAILRVTMPKDSETGWARAAFSAEKMHYSNNGCPDIREVGYREYQKFVRVEP